MLYVTRRECFNAAHKLWKPEWSDEHNEQVFGKCANKNWHGHNYELYVTVAGLPDTQTGFVVDLKQLSQILKIHIIEKLDHKNLNLDVEFMHGIMASTENIAIQIWDVLSPLVAELGAQMYCIKLKETENNFVEYYGEK